MTNVNGIAGDQLRSIIDRVERLEEEKAALAFDIREIFAEAKGNGFDVKAIKEVIRLRKLEVAERQEREHILDTYLRAIGMNHDL